MEDKHIQSMRYKLQRRVRKLNSVRPHHFYQYVKMFLNWLDTMEWLAAIRDDLVLRATDAPSLADRIIARESLLSDDEVESAAMGYHLLKKLSDNPTPATQPVYIMNGYGAKDQRDGVEMMRETFLEPFYEYLDEHLDEKQAILYFLRRYKHRSEWFQAERLRGLIEADTQRGEKRLAFDLYEHLHNDGIDFSIEPASASGIADLVAEQVGKDKVIADAKVFWPAKRKGKNYMLSAFHQAYTYARDFNEPFAYLVIYKMSKADLIFDLPQTSSRFPCFTINNKTIVFVIVDICDHGASASKRGRLTSYNINADELVQAAATPPSEEDAEEIPAAPNPAVPVVSS